MLICFTSCAQNHDAMKENTTKSLVVYFSATGTTEAVAQKLAKVAGADLFKIEPQEPYSAADLDWNDQQSRSSVEMKNPKARPAMKGAVEHIDQYEVVYIGFPIWWYEAPRIINTFIEHHSLEGKTIRIFATSGGSTIDNSLNQLKQTYPNLEWKDAKLLNRSSESILLDWVQ